MFSSKNLDSIGLFWYNLRVKRKDLETLSQDELIELVLSSRKEADEAKAERRSAESELAKARADADAAKTERDAAKADLEKAFAEVSRLNAEMERLLAIVDAKNQTILRDNFNSFVGRSEHSSAVRAKAPVIDEADAKAKGRPGRKRGSANLSLTREQLAALASETVTIEPDGKPSEEGLVRFGEDETYKIVRVPASIKVLRVVRPKYRRADGSVLQSASSDPFPHSPLTPSLAADVCSAKYEMGIPLYRYGNALAARGLKVTEQTLAQWVIRAAEIARPVADEAMRVLLEESNGVVHADETKLLVLDSLKNEDRRDSYVFVYSSSAFAHPVDVYDFRGSRAVDPEDSPLAAFGGTLVVDGYAGYNALPCKKQRCWAHVRRKFADAVKALPKGKAEKSESAWFLREIDWLFRKEREWRESAKTSSEILRLRNSPEHLARIEALREKARSVDPAPGSLLERAVKYMDRMGEELYTFLSDGRVPMDNNLAERVVKPFVIDRKNFLFSKAESGAEASATLMTVIRTALRNGLIPERYLAWLFENSGKLPTERLMPWSEDVPETFKAFGK